MILFRADGNAHIGMGHLMRSMSIASKVAEREEVIFLVSDSDSFEEVSKRGYTVYELATNPFSVEEGKEIIRFCEGLTAIPKLLVIDSYEITNDYLTEFKGNIITALMEDMAEQVFGADIIINYNTYASLDRYEELYKNIEPGPRFVLGAAYVPLRDEFQINFDREYKEVKNILITTGGSDEYNLAGRIAEELIAGNMVSENININIVCGAFNRNQSKLTELSQKFSKISIFRSVNNMAELMKNCDIAISAGGSTCYELCAMGLPFVVFAFADNQKYIIQNMEAKGVALNAGFFKPDGNNDTINRIVRLANELIVDSNLRKRISDEEREFVDGHGADRLADILIETRQSGK